MFSNDSLTRIVFGSSSTIWARVHVFLSAWLVLIASIQSAKPTVYRHVGSSAPWAVCGGSGGSGREWGEREGAGGSGGSEGNDEGE